MVFKKEIVLSNIGFLKIIAILAVMK